MALTREWVEKELRVCSRSHCVGDDECEWCALCRHWLATQDAERDLLAANESVRVLRRALAAYNPYHELLEQIQPDAQPTASSAKDGEG